MTDFAAIDFEIANYARSSVCSMGVVIVREGIMVDRIYRLIRPEPDWYLGRFTQIHGLTAEDTKDAKVFPHVWEEISPIIEGLPLVAHNSSFDQGCLRAARASRKTFGKTLPDHKLHTVATYCGYDLQNHHHALADAEACAVIALKNIVVYGNCVMLMRRHCRTN
jgi:DNA polymerase-3 subunit epsilon